MSTAVSHTTYEIIAWPERAITPDILYLQIGDGPITAAAANTVNGWLIVLFGGDTASVGTNVGDEAAAWEWLDALGRAAVAA